MAAIVPTEHIWFNGKLVPWQQATVHVLAHGLHYGSAVFEGIRAYRTSKSAGGGDANGDGGSGTGAGGATVIFRLRDHLRRLYESARIHCIDVPHPFERLHAACREVVRTNRLEAAYLRPIVFRGYGGIGVLPGPEVPVDVAIAAIAWGGHLGQDAVQQGVDACVSSWRRMAPDTLPALAKSAGNYVSSQLMAQEAHRNGYQACVALDVEGHVSEGAGENLFLVHRGVLRTPPLGASILGGITRDTVLTMARELGIEAREEPLPRELLYVADEAFYTGTAAEIAPLRSIDRQPIGESAPGPITRALQARFFGLFSGETPDVHGWLEPV